MDTRKNRYKDYNMIEQRNKDTLVIQECEACGAIWHDDRVNTRCPACGGYEIIVDAEWEEIDP